MSAFMVEDKTINRIVTYLSLNRNDHEFTKYRLKNELKIDVESEPWILGDALFKLNIIGVGERYGFGEAKGFRELNYKYEFTTVNKIQVLKSLQCLLYQCNEGENNENLLFKIMDEFKSCLMSNIIGSMPEYDQAYWG